MTTATDTQPTTDPGPVMPVVVPLDEMERLFAATTQGQWRTLADSYQPAEWFVVVGPGIFGEAVIAGPSEAMTANPDFEWIAAMHNAFPSLVAMLRRDAERSLPVDREWLESFGLTDWSTLRDEKLYRIADGLTVRCFAKVGGWGNYELWTPRQRLNAMLTRGDVVDLLNVLGKSRY